jgi:hypothetical protein
MVPTEQLLLIGCFFLAYPLSFLYSFLVNANHLTLGNHARSRHIFIGGAGIFLGCLAYGWFGLINFLLAFLSSFFLLRWRFLGMRSKAMTVGLKQAERIRHWWSAIFISTIFMVHLSVW